MTPKADLASPKSEQTEPNTDVTKRLDTEASADTALSQTPLNEDYALNPRYINLVIDAADKGDGLHLRELLDALHPADIADLLGFLSEDYRETVIPWIPVDALPEILTELDDEIREEVIDTLPTRDLAEVLQELDSDDATAVFEDLEEDQQKAVLAAMSESDREAIVTSLRFEEETAGRLMQREVMAAPAFWEVGHCIDHMREYGEDLPELFFDIYVINPSHQVVGAISVSTLMRTKRDVLLSTLMESVTEIPADMDQEEVAYIFEKYHLISAPVVDKGGRLIGQITVDDIVNIIQEENREDILALAGVSDDEGRDSSVIDVVKSRLPWLGVNLMTAFVSSTVIASFQEEIGKLLILAVLMPVVASIGGNSGTQTLTVAVRALASRELTAANAMRTLWREIRVGLFNGLAIGLGLALVATVIVYVTAQSANPVMEAAKMGLVMVMAVCINFTAAALGGTLIPLALERFDHDPAAGSPIFVTMVTDTFGYLCFLGLASLILL